MTTPINSVTHYSPISNLIERRSDIRQPQLLEARKNALVESNTQRREYISSLENYVKVNRELYASNNELIAHNNKLIASNENLIQLHKEQRQLLQESRDIGQQRFEAAGVYKQLLQDQVNTLTDTNKKLLALFDHNDSSPTKTREADKIDAPIVTSYAKLVKNENIARPDKLELSPAEKAIEKYQVVSNKPIDPLVAPREVGKVFDYVPHESVKPKDTVTLYQPNSPQIRLLAAQSKVVGHVEDVIPSQDAVKLDRVMQQLMYYSQKNIWESIVKDSLVTKLV